LRRPNAETAQGTVNRTRFATIKFLTAPTGVSEPAERFQGQTFFQSKHSSISGQGSVIQTKALISATADRRPPWWKLLAAGIGDSPVSMGTPASNQGDGRI
jgi:hypothetical protein